MSCFLGFIGTCAAAAVAAAPVTGPTLAGHTYDVGTLTASPQAYQGDTRIDGDTREKGGLPGITTLASVDHWVDGDTLWVRYDDDTEAKVRLIGVDTPEMKNDCNGAKAKKAAEELASNVVTLVHPAGVPDKDQHGRLLRYVVVDWGNLTGRTDVGSALIEANLADAAFDGEVAGQAGQDHPWREAYRSADASGDAGQCGIQSVWPYVLEGYVLSQLADWKDPSIKVPVKKPATVVKPKVSTPKVTSRPKSNASSEYGAGNWIPGYTGPRCFAPGGKVWRPC